MVIHWTLSDHWAFCLGKDFCVFHFFKVFKATHVAMYVCMYVHV